MSVDALKLKQGFQKAGLDDTQAEKMAEAIRDSLKEGELVTKADLDNAVLKLENKISRMTIGVGAVLGILITLLQIFVQ